MSDIASSRFDHEQFIELIDPTRVGAALSKLLAASIGDLVVVLSRSSSHKHFSLSDIEWMVLPPIAAGQFYVVEAEDKERGFRAPIAVATWAFVSPEVDARLIEAGGQRIRLRPDEWKSGEIGWLIDIVGEGKGLDAALHWLSTGPFKDQPLKFFVRTREGVAEVSTLQSLITLRSESTAA